MQTENTMNRKERFDDDRRNNGSRIPGMECSTGYKNCNGCMSPEQDEGQRTTREKIGKPYAELTKAKDRTGTCPERQAKFIDRTGILPEGSTKAINRTGTLPEASGKDPGPVRSKRPLVAIREAQRRAAIWGFAVAGVLSDDNLPYDFIAMKDGITSFVRVRRIRDSWFDSKRIQERCRNEIAGFRAMKQQPGLIFELWIRGYARAFHRYRVLPDAIEKIGLVLEPETRAGKKALDAVTLILHHNNLETIGETVPAISDASSP